MLLLQLPAEVLLAVWSMCPERVVAHTGVCPLDSSEAGAGAVEANQLGAVERKETYVKEVSRALSALPRLASLRLQGHCGGPALARALVKSLDGETIVSPSPSSSSQAHSTPIARRCLALTELDLSSNRLGPAGLQELEPLLIGGAAAAGSSWGGRGGAINLKSLSLGGSNSFGTAGNGYDCTSFFLFF